MRLFSYRDRPVHLGPYPLERLNRLTGSADLPPLEAEDLVVFTGAGAYGAVLASHYNMRSFPAEVMVAGEHYGIITHRQTFEDLNAHRSVWTGPATPKLQG